MEFDWTEDDLAFRRELQGFLAESLPVGWEEMAKDGPGSDVQAEFSKRFCPKLAERGWRADPSDGYRPTLSVRSEWRP